METLVIIFIIVVVIGALSGAKSFGETVQAGCGCLIFIIIALVVIAFFLANEIFSTNSTSRNYSQTNSASVTNLSDNQPVSSTEHRQRVIGSQELNVRNGANVGYEIVGKVYLGDVLVTYEQIDGWTRIGHNQWVKSSYLEPL